MHASIPRILCIASALVGFVSSAPYLTARDDDCPVVDIPTVWHLSTPVVITIPPSDDPGCFIDSIVLYEPDKVPRVLYTGTGPTNPPFITLSLPPGCQESQPHNVTIHHHHGPGGEQTQVIQVVS